MVCICLVLPSITTLILLRKSFLLAKLLSCDTNTSSSRVHTSAIICDPLNTSLIQQCRMPEVAIGIFITNECQPGMTRGYKVYKYTISAQAKWVELTNI